MKEIKNVHLKVPMKCWINLWVVQDLLKQKHETTQASHKSQTRLTAKYVIWQAVWNILKLILQMYIISITYIYIISITYIA